MSSVSVAQALQRCPVGGIVVPYSELEENGAESKQNFRSVVRVEVRLLQMVILANLYFQPRICKMCMSVKGNWGLNELRIHHSTSTPRQPALSTALAALRPRAPHPLVQHEMLV